MFVELRTHRFRGLRDTRLEFGQGLHLIWGGNAQGKTSLLEALHVLAYGRSFRTRVDSELARWNEDGFELYGRLIDGQHRVDLGVGTGTGGKQVYRNGKRCARLSEFVGSIDLIVFTPEDLALVKGPPGGRRAFLDWSVFQLDRAHHTRVRDFRRALGHRNALLKRRSPSQVIEPWTEQLVAAGAAVMNARSEVIERLAPRAAEVFTRLSAGREELAISYRAGLGRATSGDQEWSHRYSEAVEASLHEDLKRGMTQRGPHRDEMRILVDGREASSFASQGQVRSVVLALKLAQLETYTRLGRGEPVVLLDDADAELDRGRRELLAEAIEPVQQVFATALDPGRSGLGMATTRRYRVVQGAIAEDTR